MIWKVWHGDRVMSQFRRSTLDAVERAVQRTGQVADQQVPHDEGILQGSKHIARDEANMSVSIGYGGGGVTGLPIVPYALKWHEVPANFQKGRKHNYLRDPFRSELPKHMKAEFTKRGLK